MHAFTPARSGWVTWPASAFAPYPTISASGRAPRAWACSRVSRTRNAAPSPSTIPCRPRLKGRQAEGGSLPAGARTRMTFHAATTIGVQGRVGATGEHDVGPAGAEQAEGLTDGVGRRGAGHRQSENHRRFFSHDGQKLRPRQEYGIR